MFRAIRKSIRYLFLAALLLVVTLCAVEVGLRCHRAMMPAANIDGGDVNGADQPPWIVPSATTYIEMQPGGHYSVLNPDTGEEVAVHTNSYGLRGPEIEVPKTPGVLRILCIGDETTLAAATDEPATYPAMLEQFLASQTSRPIEVINAGLNQGCPLLALIHLKQRWLALQPDLIILHFDMTDVADDHRLRPWVSFDDEERAGHATHPQLRRAANHQMESWENQFVVVEWGADTLWNNWNPGEDSHSRVDINSRGGGEAWLRDDPPDWDAYVAHALEPIVEMKAIADGIGCPLMLTTTPRPWQASANASATAEARHPYGIGLNDYYGSRRPFDEISEFAAEKHIPFLDCSPSFIQYNAVDELYLAKSPEFSELGHQLYAYELAGAVMQLIPGIWTTAGGASQWE